jgi:alkenylglycerophosphocholine hydrolase
MFNGWFFLAAGLALLDWICTVRQWKRLFCVAKAGTLAALIAWFTSAGGWQGGLIWFGVGLMLGMVGDVVLELPARYFLIGLAAFLFGHLSYIAGYLAVGIALRPESLLIILVLAGSAGWNFIRLLRAMRRKPENTALLAPVLAYGVVITLMAICAGLTLINPSWPFWAAVCCAVGGTLFLVSDTVLGYQQFVKPLRHSGLIIMVTYHLAQFLIAGGVLLSL